MYNDLGAQAINAGKAGEALALFEKAVAQNPGYAEAHNNLGVVFLRTGDLQQAERHLAEAVRLLPEWSSPRDTLAQVRSLLANPGAK
ncbi:MAG: tetratricopeptide repeat protein [Verrucomicrobia bacterium]|nr:tetratricopeptide repeat protein [Verrucomicrobiota bacterium]